MKQLYCYSQEHIEKLRARCFKSRLSAPGYFWWMPLPVMREIYNGIGPDRWSSRFRKFVTWLLQWFEEEALIHDVDYASADKTYYYFTCANIRFFTNVCIAAWKRRHLRKIPLGFILALLCQTFGWSGFKNC